MHRSRWSAVAAYAALSAANQMLWLTFAPITTEAGHHYGVSVSAIGWLAQVFPLLYVVLALPAGVALDRGFRGWLAVGAALTAAGAVLRVEGGFGRVLVGQLVVALAQPLVLSAVTKVATVYLDVPDRPTGIAIGSASVFAGIVLAFVLGTVFDTAGQVDLLVLVSAVYTVVAAAALLFALRRPAPSEHVPPTTGVDLVRSAWAAPSMRVLAGLMFAGVGVFDALSTWLEALLDPAGVSASTAGLLLLELVLAGVVGSVVLPPRVARHRAEPQLLRTVLLVTAAGCTALAVAPGVVTGALTMLVMGGLLLTALPVVLEMAERRAGDAGATAAALLWMAGNAGGILVAVVVQALVDTPAAGFLVIALTALLAVPLTRRTLLAETEQVVG